MKNRNITYAKQSAKIYSGAYRPTTNLWRVMKSILGAILHGSSTEHGYADGRKRMK